MNANRILYLKGQCHPKSDSWQEEDSPPIVRFWCDDGACWGIPFQQVTATHYNPEHQSLLIDWPLGTIIVTGPKTWDFYEEFCSHRATLIEADGKDILGVTIALNRTADAGQQNPWEGRSARR
jgi:hypothetical protein